MIDKIAANNQPLIESGSSAGQPSRSRGPGDNDVDVSVEVNYASLVDKAMQPPKTDDQAIREARQLLSSGRLDNMDIIGEAAENIFKYGI
jgi:hypothetical protein